LDSEIVGLFCVKQELDYEYRMLGFEQLIVSNLY